MKTPGSLETLVDYGIIQEVVRPLMSGKEAQVYVVLAGGEERVAKVYKEAHERTFKNRVEYTEGRRTRNSRDVRAMQKRSRHGRKQDEAAWRSAEIDTIYSLHAVGVRVPEPIHFIDGVLVMELVQNAEGAPAPRLGDLSFRPEEAAEIHQKLMREVVRMLCAGIVHGDLSEFNVLMSADGPVLIDFPQSVDAARNPSARKLLLRDVENLNRFLSRFAPQQAIRPLGEEMWALYEKNRLDPETPLTGGYVAPGGPVRMDDLMGLIDDASRDERMRRDARGDETPLERPQPIRRVVDFTHESKRRPGSRPGSAAVGNASGNPSTPAQAANASKGDAAPARRRRRRRPTGTEPDPSQTATRSDRQDPPSGPAASRGPRRPDRRHEATKASSESSPKSRDSQRRGPDRSAPAQGDRAPDAQGRHAAESGRRRRRRRSPGSRSS